MTNPLQYEVTEFYSHVDCPIAQMSEQRRVLLMCELSILAYFASDAAATQSWGQTLGFTNVQVIAAADNAAVLFYNDTDLVVAFRGTDNVQNGVQDVDCFLVGDGDLPGSVHQGFLNNFNMLNAHIAPALPSLLQNRTLWVTGHSLGGSLAAIMGVRATRQAGPVPQGLYTFAQPRVGDAAYVRDAFPSLVRYVDKFDLGPHLPPLFMGYRHFGHEFFITTQNTIVEITNWKQRLMKWSAEMWGMITVGLVDHSIGRYRTVILNAYQASVKS